MPIPTPHISAKRNEIAKCVLMPGDPLRSQFVAENYLENPKLFNNVRGVQGYTGLWKGTPVSVMASGMGIPSIGIYSHELFNYYDVDAIIRIGSAGSMQPDIRLFDIVFGMGACTTSNYAEHYHLHGTFAPIADYGLLRTAVAEAEKLKARYFVGNLLSSDQFYNDFPSDTMEWARMGVLAVEMEAMGLYANAARAGKKALSICSISDSLVTHEETTSEERRSAFRTMIEIALNTAAEITRQ